MKAPTFILACCATLAALSLPAHADIDPLSSIDFVRIGAVGNAPWAGDGTAGDRAIGRGQVNYEYGIGKYEVTTAQWCEFLNAAWDRPASEVGIPWRSVPAFWGAMGATPVNSSNPNARRWQVIPGQEMRPVGGMSWRMSAIYSNWLNNDKDMARESFLTGAYDVSSFGGIIVNGFPQFTDVTTRSASARYFIPSWDEWLKAAHYDPNKQNSDGSTGGYWRYSNGTDTSYVYGPPGVLVNGELAQANAGWLNQYPGQDPFAVPLGAYGITSPWGLYDMAGATSEWTEEETWDELGLTNGLVAESSFWTSSVTVPPGQDSIYRRTGSGSPADFSLQFGFRMAMAIPAPGTVLGVVFLTGWHSCRRRRKLSCGADSQRSPH